MRIVLAMTLMMSIYMLTNRQPIAKKQVQQERIETSKVSQGI